VFPVQGKANIRHWCGTAPGERASPLVKLYLASASEQTTALRGVASTHLTGNRCPRRIRLRPFLRRLLPTIVYSIYLVSRHELVQVHEREDGEFFARRSAATQYLSP
jgi:hypothetical protein